MMKIFSIFQSTSNNSKKKKYQKIRILLFFVFYSSYANSLNSEVTTSELHFGNPIQQEQATTSNKGKLGNKTIADSLLNQSNVNIEKSDFSSALKTVEQALHIYESLGEYKLLGNCYNNIAFVNYYQGNYDVAIQYFKKCIEIFKNIDFEKGIAYATNNTGAIYYSMGNYPKALDYYKRAVQLNKKLDDARQTAATIQNIGGIYAEMKKYDQAMRYYLSAKSTYEAIDDKATLSQVLIGIGEIFIEQEEFIKALSNFEYALKIALDIDDKQRILESLFNLGKLYGEENKYRKSFNYYNRCLRLAEAIENTSYKSRSLIAIGSIQQKTDKNQLAIVNCKKGLQLAKDLKSLPYQKDACICLYNTYKSLNQNATALAYYEQSMGLKDNLQAVHTSGMLQNMEFEKEVFLDSIAHVEKEKKLQVVHEQEVAEKDRQRNILVISGCFILIVAGGLWSRLRYTSKSKARLQIEKDRSEHLLLNILPEEIAEELKEKGYVDAQDFETASILFTDFKSFTETAAKLSPQELVEEINVCFKAFDEIMGTYEIEKIKTIGDAYMAAGGLPKPDSKAVKNIILAGLAMQEFTIKRKLNNMRQNKPAFEMRVGIHVGPIVAGIVGIKKFQYDIWGDTVNTASRMESNGDVGKVNISQYTYELVKGESDLAFEYRGKVAVKGKGELPMYFVEKARN